MLRQGLCILRRTRAATAQSSDHPSASSSKDPPMLRNAIWPSEKLALPLSSFLHPSEDFKIASIPSFRNFVSPFETSSRPSEILSYSSGSITVDLRMLRNIRLSFGNNSERFSTHSSWKSFDMKFIARLGLMLPLQQRIWIFWRKNDSSPVPPSSPFSQFSFLFFEAPRALSNSSLLFGSVLRHLSQVRRTPIFFLQFYSLRSHALLLSLVGRAKDYSRIYLRKSSSRWLLFVRGVPPGS